MEYNTAAKKIFMYTTTVGGEYLKSGHKIKWIKGCREVTGLSLKDSKDFCDLISNPNTPVPSYIRRAWDQAVSVMDVEGRFPEYGISF